MTNMVILAPLVLPTAKTTPDLAGVKIVYSSLRLQIKSKKYYFISIFVD